VHFAPYATIGHIMDTKEAGRMGALITNSKLTTEGRRKAAKKGWRNKKKLQEKKSSSSG
jgi:hypothetical protein